MDSGGKGDGKGDKEFEALAGTAMDDGWYPWDGSEAQNIIRQAETAPDSPFRPRFMRKSFKTIPPLSFVGVGMSSGSTWAAAVSRIKINVLMEKQPVAEALASFLTLRDVFKIGMTSRDLMNRLLMGVVGVTNTIGASIDPAAVPNHHGGVSRASRTGDLPSEEANSAVENRGSPLLVHIRGGKEFLAYFRAIEQRAAWTQGRLMAVSIVLDYHDHIEGPIPPFLGGGNGVNTVDWLDLCRSNLTGRIPETLGTLPNLRRLFLAGNKLVGSIPSSLGDLGTLSELSLAGNELTGTIPPSFGNLTLLRYLSVRDNKLSGPIPDSLGNLVNLEELWLNANSIEGEIPESLGNMVTARKIFLNNNCIQGTIPASLGNLSNLRILSLRHNRLSGRVPPELGRLSQLKTLYMEKNELEGTIPDTLANLASLEELNLIGNRFQGKAATRNLLIGKLPNCMVYV